MHLVMLKDRLSCYKSSSKSTAISKFSSESIICSSCVCFSPKLFLAAELELGFDDEVSASCADCKISFLLMESTEEAGVGIGPTQLFLRGGL